MDPEKSAVTDLAQDSPDAIGQQNEKYAEATGIVLPQSKVAQITRTSSILGVLVSGIALFSDGYNAQIIGYMEPLFSDL
jgi:hypothetical protein